MDDLLGVPNERLKDLLAELPEGACIWLGMHLGQRVK